MLGSERNFIDFIDFFDVSLIHIGNGQIDIHDLSEALKDTHLSHQYAETFLRQTDTTNRGHVNLAEFIHYIREHEKNLLLHFTHLDKDRDGKVNLDDLISGFKEIGIDIDNDEALTVNYFFFNRIFICFYKFRKIV